MPCKLVMDSSIVNLQTVKLFYLVIYCLCSKNSFSFTLQLEFSQFLFPFSLRNYKIDHQSCIQETDTAPVASKRLYNSFCGHSCRKVLLSPTIVTSFFFPCNVAKHCLFSSAIVHSGFSWFYDAIIY